MPSEIIDSHQHLWRYDPERYPWMTTGMDVLRRDYLLPELNQTVRSSGITGTIAVQARETVEETAWLSRLAQESETICGVVGWAPLTAPDAEMHLERLSVLPKVKGVRHILQSEPDDFYMLREDFTRGVSLLEPFGLRYDILIYERHLPQTIKLVDRHPKQIFILDHIAKPKIHERQLSPWRENIIELARRRNVYCKLSGMVTEADWLQWNSADLAPYFDTVLDAFGPGRLMFGSDWPVVNLAASYDHWLGVVKENIGKLSAGEQDRIFFHTAVEAYGL